jgi:DNA ligase (NAD+)
LAHIFTTPVNSATTAVLLRKELKAAIEAEGGKVAGSVSAKTDYLITNDPNSGSSKNKAARELGVAIITENDIMNMLG